MKGNYTRAKDANEQWMWESECEERAETKGDTKASTFCKINCEYMTTHKMCSWALCRELCSNHLIAYPWKCFSSHAFFKGCNTYVYCINGRIQTLAWLSMLKAFNYLFTNGCVHVRQLSLSLFCIDDTYTIIIMLLVLILNVLTHFRHQNKIFHAMLEIHTPYEVISSMACKD